MVGIFDDFSKKANGLFSEPTTAQMIGLQMLGNSGPSVGAPRNMFEGIPQAVMAGNQIERERVQRIADKASKEKRLQWLTNARPDLAEQVAAGLDADVAYKQATNDLFAKPELTTLQKNYNLAKQQGFDGTIMDYQTQLKKAGANNTNINMPSAPTIGSIPQGFQAIQDPESGSYRMERIPGGPEDQTEAKAVKFEQERQKATVARSAISDIKAALNSEGLFGIPFLNLPETGVMGSKLAGINQEATDVRNSLATLQSIVSFDRLQAMREASPTGGALGSVSERELALLQASLGALSQDSSEEQLIKTLDFIDGIMAKFEAYPDSAGTPYVTPPAQNGGVSLKDKYGLE